MDFDLTITDEKQATPNPVCYPGCGPVIGQNRRDIISFKGIPYGTPPTGDLRFKPPLPAKPWTEPKECFEFGSKCYQYGYMLADLPSMYSSEGKSEDCLYLNVWTPAMTDASSLGQKYPVYVYIHGGGFTTGSGGELMFDGTNMAKRGIVVVTINYRLGAFGFLALESLLAESGTTGNYGLMDQILALQWVNENIGAFGGDATNITIGGESAGAFSVTALLMSPLSSGLFRRAIIESGSILSIGAFATRSKGNLKRSIAMGQDFADIFDIADTPEGLKQLRALPPEVIGHLSMMKADRALPMRFAFWPVFDDAVLPVDPMDNLKKGKYNGVDILLGYNTDEATLFIKNNSSFGSYQFLSYEFFGARHAEAIQKAFPLFVEKDAEKVIESIFNYTGFILGMRIFADYFSEAGHNVYFYNFDYDPAILKIVGLDTAHSLELPFVFGNLVGKMKISRISILSDQMQTCWTNFMKHGDPNRGDTYKNQATWEPYDKEMRKMMVFGKKLIMKPMPDKDMLNFLEGLLFGTEPYYL